jgi:hypothetical protein
MAPTIQIRKRLPPRGFKNVLKMCLAGAWILMICRTPADPDLWGHVRFGQDLLASGRLSAVDPYSFTSDRPWVNHEWLSEVLMALAFGRADAVGLNLLRLLVVGAALAFVWRRAQVVAPAYRSILVALAAVGITLRALPVRPQLFSLACFAALLAVLTTAEEKRRDALLLWIPPIFALWVNLHGGWIVGLGTMGLWTVACLFNRPRRRWWALPAATAAAALATLINPYGVGMWSFLSATVGANRPMISDWLPMYKMPPAFWLGWLIGAGLCVAAWRQRARVPLWYLAPVAILGVAAIRVNRLDAFFCLTAVFLLTSVFPAAEIENGVLDRPSRAMQFAAVTCGCAIAIAATLQLRHLDVRPDLMPESASVEYVLEQRLTGRFLTWFDWGEFAIWHLADHDVRVSIDGRRETVYSDTVVNDHLRFYAAANDTVDYARRIQADYAWLPIGLPAVKTLEAEGWSLAFKGPVSVILRAPGHAVGVPRVVDRTAVREFPGP